MCCHGQSAPPVAESSQCLRSIGRLSLFSPNHRAKTAHWSDCHCARWQSHRRQGRSQLGIRQRLRQHRLDDDVIDAALEVADEHAADGELLAACRFARRRRIGPFDHRRNDGDSRDAIMQRMQRQLGAMARAGFAMAISRKVFDLADSTAGESLIDQLEHGEDPTV